MGRAPSRSEPISSVATASGFSSPRNARDSTGWRGCCRSAPSWAGSASSASWCIALCQGAGLPGMRSYPRSIPGTPAGCRRSSRSGGSEGVEYLIASLLIFLALTPVIAPFLRTREETPPQPGHAELQELLGEKQTLYVAIKELEFDHQAGKLALEDYQQTRRSYELRAVALLEQIDQLDQGDASKGARSREEQR